MLDEGPLGEPTVPSEPAAPLDLGDASPVGAPSTAAATSATSAGAPEASGAALLAADVKGAWAALEPTARLLFGLSAAAFVIVLVGLPLSVWDSASFALLVMAATAVTASTAWFGGNAAWRSSPIPLPTVELMATLVIAVLAILKLIEVLFNLDTDGLVGLVVAGALVGAAAALLIAARRRGADPLGSLLRGDQGSMIATVGLALVMLGWAFNLSVSFWTMGQAALPLAVLTLATLTVAEAPRIQSPVPVAWIGAGIGAFGAILALAHWGDLTTLGRTELVLDPGDFLGLLAYTAGAALIIVGGALSGRGAWAASHPAGPGPLVEG